MGFDQILFVLTPILVGLVAFILAIHLMRSLGDESRPRPERKVWAVLMLLFSAGCLLSSFALWVCIGVLPH